MQIKVIEIRDANFTEKIGIGIVLFFMILGSLQIFIEFKLLQQPNSCYQLDHKSNTTNSAQSPK